jgi:hypothetical protein
MGDAQKEDAGLVTRLGQITIDWPRTVGYYGAIAAAVAFDVIAPPLGLFIAAVPLLKLLKRKHASRLERGLAAVLEGAAKPVGGDSESTIRPTWVDHARPAAVGSLRARPSTAAHVKRTRKGSSGHPR